MSLKNILSSIWNKFEDALFVNFSCLFCGIETPNESLVCDKCASSLKFINGAVCNKCGAPTDVIETTCYNCFNKNYRFDYHRSCIIYEKLSSRPIKALKYSGKRYLASPIARIMYAVNKDVFHDIDYITYVPMSSEKKENRGYNHTEEIAKELGKIANLPVEEFLIKTRDTGDQARLKFEERTKNLKNSFEVDDKLKEILKNKNIVLVDDVFTTGSTMNECSKALLKGNAYSVVCLSFLKTDPNAESDPFGDDDEIN